MDIRSIKTLDAMYLTLHVVINKLSYTIHCKIIFLYAAVYWKEIDTILKKRKYESLTIGPMVRTVRLTMVVPRETRCNFIQIKTK